MTLRKVVCVICRGIFKVEEDPPAEIVAPCYDAEGRPADPYSLSALRLTDDPDSVDYCQRKCSWCRRGSPWPTEQELGDTDEELGDEESEDDDAK